MDCLVSGWGTGSWGVMPWGGTTASFIGGALPVAPPFDLYCLGPCGPMAGVLTHPDVSTSSGDHFFIDPGTLNLGVASGGSYGSDTGYLTISTTVPASWTLEFTVFFDELPANFSDLLNKHLFVGTSDAQGATAGLFFSQIGIAYTGAVHHDGSGTLVLDSPVQVLPGSQTLIEPKVYYTYRLAADFASGTTYLFVTKTSEVQVGGHQLRYVLPGVASSSCASVPPDQTMLSAKGTLAEPSIFLFDSLCLATGLVIPNLPPRADAGIDQAVRTCTVVQLDGSKSFDPEGAQVRYKWRLIDTPLGSQYIFDGVDGITRPLSVPTGFTDTFYSVSLGDENAIDAVVPGDVIVLGGAVHVVQSTGTDVDGFYVRVEGYLLPDSYSTPVPFKYVRQRGISGTTAAKPTFYPDLSGLFKFDLTVFDGQLYSEPVVTIVNVTESPVPRGVVPDLRFLWGYLSDFWKLVEDKERIEVFWGGLAQIAASELLNLWQLEYSKSLRDVQRTFQRRWLRYDLLMQEDPLRIEETTVRAVFGGVLSSGTVSGVFSLTTGDVLSLAGPTGTVATVTWSGTGDFTAEEVASRLSNALSAVDSNYSVTVVVPNSGVGSWLLLNAPFYFSVLPATTIPMFGVGQENGVASGTGGALVATRTYKVGRSLLGLGIVQGDFLVLGDTAYQIVRVLTDPSDQDPLQRVIVVEDLPPTVGSSWAIAGQAASKTLNFWQGLVSNGDEVVFEVLRKSDGALAHSSAVALGACQAVPGTLAVDATPLGLFLSQPALYSVYLKQVLRRHYIPRDPLVVDIPYLQEKIKATNDQEVLRRNVDFFLEEFRGAPCVRFVVGSSDVWQQTSPPNRMWAETTYLDNRPLIEGTFGIPAEFTLDDLSQLSTNVDYLSSVRGLWYAYFNGPTLFNLRAGTQILLGLPFAEEEGTIEEIRQDFSTTQGRILIRDSANTEIVRSYSFPQTLSLETNPDTKAPYKTGDMVRQFAPLVQGVELLDYQKDPEWFKGYLQQGSFYEVEKFFKFLVRVDSKAFNLSGLLFVKNFILRIKPTYTYPFFVVLQRVDPDEISVTDETTTSGTLSLFDGPNYPSGLGTPGAYDQPRAGGGGVWGHYDQSNPNTSPTYPTSELPVAFGFDRENLSPAMVLEARCSTTLASAGPPTYDSIFAFDLPYYTTKYTSFAAGSVTYVPSSGLLLQNDFTASGSGSITLVTLQLKDLDGVGGNFELILSKNGTDQVTLAFSLGSTPATLRKGFAPTPISFIAGDVLRARVRKTSGAASVFWEEVGVQVGQGSFWTYDQTLSAGTYSVYNSL